MLLLASSDAKTWTLHQSQVDIDTLLISLYETYEQTCIKNGIQLKVNLSEDTYPVLNTDKDRLFQILCIFMDNAIQHAKDNSLLEIQAVHTKHQIAFSVIDHGQGITDEDKKKFVHFRVNQIITKYREVVSADIPDRLHDVIVSEINVSQFKNMRDLNKKIKDTFVAHIKS